MFDKSAAALGSTYMPMLHSAVIASVTGVALSVYPTPRPYACWRQGERESNNLCPRWMAMLDGGGNNRKK